MLACGPDGGPRAPSAGGEDYFEAAAVLQAVLASLARGMLTRQTSFDAERYRNDVGVYC